jgi:hypothetical protein
MMNIDYWLAVPLIGIALTIAFLVWGLISYLRDRRKENARYIR